MSAAQAAALDKSCLFEQGGSTTAVGSSGEPTTGASVTTGSTGGTTIGETTIEGTTVAETTSGSTTTATTGSTSGASTGGLVCDPEEDLSPVECVDDGPYCVAPDTCGPCDLLGGAGKTCADDDPSKTVCDGASGRCVECTYADTSGCPVDKPGCDEETGTCSKCTEHSQCPDTACDMKLGTCFPGDSVIYVENTAAVCAGGNGTDAKPFCSLFAAVNALTPGEPTTIKVRPGKTSSAMQPLALASEGYVVAIVRGVPQIPTLDGSANNEAMIQVTPNSRVYLSDLRIVNTNGPSIVECVGAQNGAELYIDDTLIYSNLQQAKAIDASNCATRLRRSRVFKNKSGVQLAGGSLWAENSHFTQNGTGAANFGAFNFLGGATATITYSSIAYNLPTVTASTFNCNGAGTITLRNSAAVGPPVFNKGCTIDSDGGVVDSPGNAAEADQTAQEWFTGPTEGVLRPKVVGDAGPLEDLGVWVDGDPRRDFDREPRPTGAPSWAGADEPQ